jgi:putative sterol carrier protein
VSETTAASALDEARSWTTKHGHVEGLDGLNDQLRLRAGNDNVGFLQVIDGSVEIAQAGEADTVLACDSLQTLQRLLGGELHPVIARLQGRAHIEGDPSRALEILLGLREGSPWRGVALQG